MSLARQEVRLWRDPALGAAGTELSCGRDVQFAFGPLIRDEVTILVVIGGALRCRIGQVESIASAGHVLLVSSGECFEGEAISSLGWSWRAFYPDIETLAEMSSELVSGPPALGPQPSELKQDRVLARRLALLHRAIELDECNPFARQQAFAAALAAVLQDGVRPPGWPRRPRPSSEAIRRAIDCVHARFSDPALASTDLAAAAGYSQYHFMRSFSAAMGVTVHDYVVQRRLHAARAMLARGAPAANVALAAGFSDQSHLIRQFRAVHGLTPGQFAQQSRRRALSRPLAAGVRPGQGRKS